MPILNPSSQGQARQLAGRGAVADAQGVRNRDAILQQVGDAEGAKNSRAVGSDLDTGAFFGNRRAALADVRFDAVPGECEGRCEAADATACDNGRSIGCGHQPASGGEGICRFIASGGIGDKAAFRIALIGLEARVVDIERRAIGTQDLAVLSHVEVDMGMIEGRPGAHAVEFLDADEDALGAGVVCEMRDQCSGHAMPFCEQRDLRLHHTVGAVVMVGDIKLSGEIPTVTAVDHFDSDGVDIAFIDTGGGKDRLPVLLIHGFASNVQTNWTNTGWVDFLAKAGYRVIAFDNRGHGQSQKLYELNDYGAPLMAEDGRRLLDHLGVGQAHVIGYSMGARIAAFLALAHPKRVARLVFGGLGVNMVRGMAGTGPIARALEARQYRRRDQSDGADVPRLCRADEKRPQGACSVHSFGAGADHRRDGRARSGRPSLIAVGEDDVIGGSAEELAKLIPGARAYTIPGRDHNRAVGDRTFKAEVLAFLAGT